MLAILNIEIGRGREIRFQLSELQQLVVSSFPIRDGYSAEGNQSYR